MNTLQGKQNNLPPTPLAQGLNDTLALMSIGG